MKKLSFISALLCTCVLCYAQEPQNNRQRDEAAYIQALEYVYAGQYTKARPILEALARSSGDPQIAQALAGVYMSILTNQPKAETLKIYPSIKDSLMELMDKSPSEALLEEALRISSGMDDRVFAEALVDSYLKSNPESVVAGGLKAYFSTLRYYENEQGAGTQKDPWELIRLNASTARAEATSLAEVFYVVRARETMAFAHEALGNRREALKYQRLAQVAHKHPMPVLLSYEMEFLNFAYAVKQFESFDVNSFSAVSQREGYLGILFAEGSKESLHKIDAFISAQKKLSPYEEALSLYRRGITPRALSMLEAASNSDMLKEHPWFYLDLRYKLLERIQDYEGLEPVAASLGGRAYLRGQNRLALSYLTNLKENDKGELSYLLGSVYLRQKNYSRAAHWFRQHLVFEDSCYRYPALASLIQIAMSEGDYKAAEDYLVRYEASDNTESQYGMLVRGQIAVKSKQYDKAAAIFEEIFQQTYNQKALKAAYEELASFYLAEWMKTNEDKQILMSKARLYSAKAYELALTETAGPARDAQVLNLYAYIHALSSEMGLPPAALSAAREAAAASPICEILDTAAVTFMEASRLKIEGAEDPAPYFIAIEREMALLDQETAYAKVTAPPYMDETASRNPQYSEIYQHLAAWYYSQGLPELGQKYENEALSGGGRPEVRAQIKALRDAWAQEKMQ